MVDATDEYVRVLIRRPHAYWFLNETFAEPEAEVEVPELPLWKQPWVWDVARQAGGVLLVLLLAFGVLRPTMRNLVAREVTERQLEQAAARLPAPGPDGEPSAVQELRHDQRLDAVRALAQEDPRRVANVVKSWVGQDA